MIEYKISRETEEGQGQACQEPPVRDRWHEYVIHAWVVLEHAQEFSTQRQLVLSHQLKTGGKFPTFLEAFIEQHGYYTNSTPVMDFYYTTISQLPLSYGDNLGYVISGIEIYEFSGGGRRKQKGKITWSSKKAWHGRKPCHGKKR